MPELPEVEAVRRELEPALKGKRFRHVEARRPNLRTAFPSDFHERLTGQTVRSVDRRGKYLLVRLGSGDTLVMHLGMSGSFQVIAHGDPSVVTDPHDHVVFVMSSGAMIVFNDPRRFGLMDVVAREGLEGYPALSAMGREPLSDEFSAGSLARACRGKKTPLKAALLDQRVVAGVGNIYASEALHRARLSPRRRASTIATPGGAPREAARKLAAAIKTVLTQAIRRSERPYRSGDFRVYDREGARCPNRGCTGTIKRITQAGRSTFYCPVCQR